MALPRHMPRPRVGIHAHSVRAQRARFATTRRTLRTPWAAPASAEDKSAQWKDQAGKIRSGAQKSMLSILEERGLVKDVAGGRDALDWLLTEKPIGVYVGVDPTAPSLHVGHLLPLMVKYWMYLYGFPCYTLLGSGTAHIGDPSGKTTARTQQNTSNIYMNQSAMKHQMVRIWKNVNELGVRHQYPNEVGRKKAVLGNWEWLRKLSALELMKTLGSNMRLGALLARDSVRTRMENGAGMSLAEFCYPLFQGYDWWELYSASGVQLQVGGSDQYGNICAGMEAVEIMRKLRPEAIKAPFESENDALSATFGLTTPLLTTASGEKFGKSAGNAVWLDQDMLNSFDLYQYFLSTSDEDVERYLKLFTFIPIESINMVMEAHRQEPSRRIAQHLLAREAVELAHGSFAAKHAEKAHKSAFRLGTSYYDLGGLRTVLRDAEKVEEKKSSEPKTKTPEDISRETVLAYKMQFAAGAAKAPSAISTDPLSNAFTSPDLVTLPLTLLKGANFPSLLYAAGLASSKSEASRLIRNKGAYVVVPNSGAEDTPLYLKWEPIAEATNPNDFVVDEEALVLRSGKSKLRICRFLDAEQFDAAGLSCPGWEDFKSKQNSIKSE